ncbi:tail fiber domain-containing protein [Chromobacterium vaccinii]|uniref:tail fiber domain-containing protein n=1 Tax=Chromobacterium vaccinii TaxID=1108595 RepID=UPI001E612E3E|nr:tail fiber domain-containing protein [Chromobacterium vaccinii]MCD4500502.1 tail fiber domain-containing protein [Chromobacterium vaccinii]
MKEQNRSQRGLSLLEIGSAMALMAVIMGGMAWYVGDSREKVSLRNDAQHFALVAQAATRYVEANRARLTPNVPPTPDATAWAVERRTATELRNAGFLAAGVGVQLGPKHRQEMELLIRAVPTPGDAPSRWTLQGLLISTDGNSYSDSELGQMVAVAGAAAGFPRRGAAMVMGANGGWQAPLADWSSFLAAGRPSPGHMAALVTAGLNSQSANDQVLHRVSVSGQPELNQMSTTLDMNRQSISNARDVQAERITHSRAGQALTLGSDQGSVVLNQGNIFVNLRMGGNNVQRRFLSSVDVDRIVQPAVWEWRESSRFSQFNSRWREQVTPEVVIPGRKNLQLGSADYFSDFNVVNGNISASGRVTAAAGVFHGVQQLSDSRLKKDVLPLTQSLEKINQLNGYSYRWKKNNERDMGLIAQQLEKIYPDIVKRNDKGFLSVSYHGLIAPLVEAVKELHQLILSLQEKFKQLFDTQNQQQFEIARLTAELAQQKQAFILLKQALKQPLSTEERGLCGAPCAAE